MFNLNIAILSRFDYLVNRFFVDKIKDFNTFDFLIIKAYNYSDCFALESYREIVGEYIKRELYNYVQEIF